MDSKKVTTTQAFAAALKEHLTEILKQPVEARLLRFNALECAGTFLVEYFTGEDVFKYNEASRVQFFCRT